MDILALVLNRLKPRYVNTHEGELLKRADASHLQSIVDIDVEIMKAIEIVSRSPHHAPKTE